ncbi:hypothetical protein BDF14DRAFT_1799114 [Spinellus fusiger]|nr:hypothetical protein BDF14DRAFT_1799114 [Spinellus fusiger]
MFYIQKIQLCISVVLLLNAVFILYRWSDTLNMFPYANEVLSPDTPAVKAIDLKYCGGPCRFLLPVTIIEQESKAQMHFRQIAFMAGLVNRTVVLPNVENARLGACLQHPFDFYYSTKWVDKNRQHFRAITMETFILWLEERRAHNKNTQHRDTSIERARAPNTHLMGRPHCLHSLMGSHQHPDRRLIMHETGRATLRIDYQEQIREFLLRENENIEVLSLSYDRRYPFIHDSHANVHIPYSEHTIQLADTLASDLGDYWAVHWRTETLRPATNLVPCAHTLATLLSSQSSFLLLTDYPHTFSEAAIQSAIRTNTTDPTEMYSASATFKLNSLTPYHHQAMAYLYSQIPVKVTSLQYATEKLTGTPPPQWTILSVSDADSRNDTGLLGILDKLLAMRATVFFAGTPNVCGRSSSFTTRIIDARKHAILKGAHISNTVRYFGLAP